MSLSASRQFAKAAVKQSPALKRDWPAPFSIRLSAEERAYLKRKAGSCPLGTYIRAKRLAGRATRRKPVRAPSMDCALLGQMLGKLGQSEQVSCLFLLLAAAEAEQVVMAEDDRAALQRRLCRRAGDAGAADEGLRPAGRKPSSFAKASGD